MSEPELQRLIDLLFEYLAHAGAERPELTEILGILRRALEGPAVAAWLRGQGFAVAAALGPGPAPGPPAGPVLPGTEPGAGDGYSA